MLNFLDGTSKIIFIGRCVGRVMTETLCEV